MKNTTTRDYAIAQYFDDIKSFHKLPNDKELKLIKLAQNGDVEAKNEVILANLKLVATLAGKYNNDKLQYLDLVQEGNIALANAVMKFDVNSNNKFSAYAGRAINTAFRDLYDKEYRAIRLPANISRLATKIAKARLSFLQENCCEANDYELLEYSNGSITKEELETVNAYSYKEVSLDEPMFDDIDDGPFSEYVWDKNEDERISAISKALTMLSDEEYESLDYQFSLSENNRSNEQIHSKEEIEKSFKHLEHLLKEYFMFCGCSNIPQ